MELYFKLYSTFPSYLCPSIPFCLLALFSCSSLASLC